MRYGDAPHLAIREIPMCGQDRFIYHLNVRIFLAHSNASASYVIPKKGTKRHGRTKRGVAQLYSMVKCATGCDPIVYKGYGCYCGFLGQGEPLVSVLFTAAFGRRQEGEDNSTVLSRQRHKIIFHSTDRSSSFFIRPVSP